MKVKFLPLIPDELNSNGIAEVMWEVKQVPGMLAGK